MAGPLVNDKQYLDNLESNANVKNVVCWEKV